MKALSITLQILPLLIDSEGELDAERKHSLGVQQWKRAVCLVFIPRRQDEQLLKQLL